MTLTLIENSPKRRDKLIIMAEIVSIAKKGTSKTQIMFKANLSFSQLNQYLLLLSQTSLLDKSACNGKAIYRATQKGLEFMEKQQQIMDLLNEDVRVYRNGMKAPLFDY
ncbi:MAG: winged helix-turn-helix domain-containing protein [Candidatus Bathyarchaeia archaeon]|jgi:predicted transcriptional regulator